MATTPVTDIERYRGASYQEIVSSFRWDVPESFNFGVDVIDWWAREQDGLALLWQNAAGEQRSYRYSDLARLSNRFANVLRAHGLEKGDRLLVMLPRIPEWPIVMIAALKIGVVPIPSIEMLTEKDVAYRIDNSGAKGIVCRASTCAKLGTATDTAAFRLAIGPADSWLDYEAEMATVSDDLEPARIDAEDPAIIYYTSGSTGKPKGVLHSARAIYSWRMSGIYWLDLKPGDRMWCTADTGWSKAGTSILFGPWSCGACSFIYDGPFTPAERLALLDQYRITVYCAPGTELFRLVGEDMASYDLSALRRTISGGESVNPVIADRWEKATGVRIDEGYGQTEALIVLANYAGEPVKYGSMGRPCPGSQVDVIDGEGRPLDAAQEGDVALRMPNPQMMIGYWQDPERSAACFRDTVHGRWYLTGDRAEKDADGYFWYRGRTDDVINSAGYRIGPIEVESAILEHPAVETCAVIGSPDLERGEIVKAFIVLRRSFAASDDLTREIQAHVKMTTAPYKYPRAIEYLAEMPKTNTGKINRLELRQMETARAR
jgi:acetyl-CoA synthetase